MTSVELGLPRDSPARRVEFLKTPKKNPRFFDEAEIRLILGDCDDEWLRDIHFALFLTGMRIGELVNVEWEDVDLVARRLIVRAKTFWKAKGNEERSIPLHGAFYDLFCGKERKSNWVFTKADGEKVNIHSLEARFKSQLRRLGIKIATLHTWRNTFASHLAMLTGNLRAVQILLGHKSGRTTEIYSHLADKHLETVVNQLPSPNFGHTCRFAGTRDCANSQRSPKRLSEVIEKILIPLIPLSNRRGLNQPLLCQRRLHLCQKLLTPSCPPL